MEENGDMAHPDLRLAPPTLTVTLHSDGLGSDIPENGRICEWLIETAKRFRHNVIKPPTIDVRATASRHAMPPPWMDTVQPIDGSEWVEEDETIDYNRDVRSWYQSVKRLNWAGVADGREDLHPANIDLEFHTLLGRDLFITADENLLGDLYTSPATPHRERLFNKTLVLPPLRAQRYIELYLNTFHDYRVTPNFLVSRSIYYNRRMREAIPAFSAAWRYAVYGRDVLPRGDVIEDYLNALAHRMTWLMSAHDRIGWLRYSPISNDVVDEVVYQLNYFIVLATGVFDTLAWLSFHRYEMDTGMIDRNSVVLKRPRNNTPRRRIRSQRFYDQLDIVAPELAAYLNDVQQQLRIRVFYGPRDSIQHRLVLTGIRAFSRNPLSNCTVTAIDQDTALDIQLVDAEEVEHGPFTKWGIDPLTIGVLPPGKTLLEPYCFSRTALRFIFELANVVLQRLDMDSWVRAFPEVKEQADNAPVAPMSDVAFAVPYP